MMEIYTDGACSGNPGPGGWAAILITAEGRAVLKGSAEETTNNRMELTAAMEALSVAPPDSEVRLYSDSQYLIKTMTEGWKRNTNLDLWKRIDKVAKRRKVEWIWLKGHVGHPENENANDIAVSMIPRKTADKKKGPSHFDAASGEVHMVDVSDKDVTQRTAVAKGSVKMEPGTLALIRDNQVAKGDVLALAQTAGIMAAKRTSELIPLCHPLRITNVAIEFDLDEATSSVNITATVKASEKTGVEMEALTAASISALTIYDMCKAVDRGMRIDNVRMVHKQGGKSGVIDLE